MQEDIYIKKNSLRQNTPSRTVLTDKTLHFRVNGWRKIIIWLKHFTQSVIKCGNQVSIFFKNIYILYMARTKWKFLVWDFTNVYWKKLLHTSRIGFHIANHTSMSLLMVVQDCLLMVFLLDFLLFFFPLNFEFTKLIVDLGCGNIEQTTGSLYFWAAHLAGPKWGPFASWCCAWLETIGVVSGMGAQVNLATSFQHISCCILNLLYKYNGLQKPINLLW